MIIKKYVADNINDALNMIKSELGPHAVIVSKKNVKQRGLFGIFLPKKLEITAAVDEIAVKAPSEINKSYWPKETDEKDDVERELGEVKEMLKRLINDKENDTKKYKKTGIKKLLIERDVSEDVIYSITNNLKKLDKYKNVSRLPDSAIIDVVKEVIQTDTYKEGRIYAFVGPTGVGKTTTIAKLAAIYSLNTKKKVGLVTIDTYRIGAVEQLKIYADILGLPFEVINSFDNIQKSLDNLKDCDAIFVDTTGRSIKNIMQLSELKLYLDKIKPDVTYLVISMTTKYHDLLRILRGFSIINYNSIILTKFDETSTYGSVLNVAYNAGVPISYISIGQNVPDDIEEATSERLVDLVLGEGNI